MDIHSRAKLWNRDFTILWLGLAQSYLGDAFLAIGLMWLALELTGSPAVAGTIIALGGLPKLLGPIAGTIVDRFSKRLLLISSDLFRGMLLVTVFVVGHFGLLEVWHLYVVVVVLGTFEILYGSAMQVLLPTLIPDRSLPAANGILQSTLQGNLILGASMAGVALAALGARSALFIDGLTFLVAAAVLFFVRFPSSLLRSESLRVREVLQDIVQGFLYILRSREILGLTGLAFIINLVLSPVNVILPVFSKTVLQGGITGYGLLASAIASGLLLGNMIVGFIGDRLPHSRSILVGLLGMAFALGGLSFSRVLVEGVTLTVILGITVPFIQIPLTTRLQRIVPQNFRGRVFATLQSLVKLTTPLAAILAGQALMTFTVGTVFRVAGLGILGIAVMWMTKWARGVRQAELVGADEVSGTGAQLDER